MRRLVLAVAVLLLVLVAWRALSDGSGPFGSALGRPPAAAPTTPPAPGHARGLVGQPGAVAPRRGATRVLPPPRGVFRVPGPADVGPGRVLAGRVVTGDGRPVARAPVWQISKLASEGMGVRAFASTVAGEDGAFRLAARPLPGTWIGARGEGLAPAFLDGDQVETGREVDIRLPPLVLVEVRLTEPGGAPVAQAMVRGRPATRHGAVPAWAGPESPLATVLETTDEDGRATLRFDRPVPVVVEALDLVTDPPEAVAEPGGRGVWLVVAPPGRLVLDVLDPATGEALAESVHLEVYDARGDPTAVTYTTDDTPDVIEADLPLPPGAYSLEVTAEGREPEIRSFELDAPGREVREVVRLGSLAAAGDLVVTGLPVTGQGLEREGSALAPFAFVRRLDGAWSRLGWQAETPTREAADTLRFSLRPGRYDVVIALPATGETADLGGVTVVAGRAARTPARVRPGHAFRLYDALPPDVAVSALRVEVPGWGSFPAAGRLGTTELRAGEDALGAVHAAESAARRDPLAGPTLGPYPDGSAVLHVTDLGGEDLVFPAP